MNTRYILESGTYLHAIVHHKQGVVGTFLDKGLAESIVKYLNVSAAPEQRKSHANSFCPNCGADQIHRGPECPRYIELNS